MQVGDLGLAIQKPFCGMHYAAECLNRHPGTHLMSDVRTCNDAYVKLTGVQEREPGMQR